MRLTRSLKLPSLIKLLIRSTSRRDSVIPFPGISNQSPRVPSLLLTEVGGDSNANNTDSQRSQPSQTIPIVCAELGFCPVATEPPQDLAQINPDDSFGAELEEKPVIEISKYNFSSFIPFDCHKSQSPESPNNSHWQPRYDNMIFFDPKENSDSPRDQSDHRRKKFLTVISANSISTPASPSTSPHKKTDISNDDIQNTYQQSLIKMKDILLEIEKLEYSKAEIIEACQYAKEFKGIMNGMAGVIGKLKIENPRLSEDEITGKFEKLKNISSLFQKKCWDNEIYSGRDENSLKPEYKFANGKKNNRPGLRLTYIPQEALEMFKNHDAAQAEPVIFSLRPEASLPRFQ